MVSTNTNLSGAVISTKNPEIATLTFVGSSLYCAVRGGYKDEGGDLFLSDDNGSTWRNCAWQAKLNAEKTLAHKEFWDKEKVKSDSSAAIKNEGEVNSKIIDAYFKGIAEKSYKNMDVAILNLTKALSLKPDFTEALKARLACYNDR